MDDYIISEELKQDKNLKLSNDDDGVKTIIEESIHSDFVDSQNKINVLRNLLEKPISSPNHYVLAALSERIYNGEKKDKSGQYLHGHIVLDNYNWRLLTVAESSKELTSNTLTRNGIHLFNKAVQKVTTGYFGAAYWEPDSQHITIVHSGTKSLDGVLSDMNGVLLNRHVTQIDSAITFTDRIIKIVKNINQSKGVNIQLFITGHSLGAWLAPITAFSARYLVKKDDKFIASSNFEESGYHTSTVIFDPPGCEEMLRRIQSKVMNRNIDNKSMINCLDITTFLSAPNLINACNPQVGDTYRLLVDLSSSDKKDFKEDWKDFFNTFINYTRYTHSIDKIKNTFDPVTGEILKDKEGNLRIKKVKDWPLLLSGDESSKSRNKILKTIMWILKFVLTKVPIANLVIDITEGVYALGSFVKWHKEFKEELINFFKLAKKSNDYLPTQEDLILESGGRKIRYKDENISKNYRNERNINAFSRSELQFLERFKFLEAFQDNLHNNLRDCFDNDLDNDEKLVKNTVNILSSCELKNGKVCSENVQMCMLYIKYMLYFFPDIKRRVETIYKSLPCNIQKQFYHKISLLYLDTIQNSLDLKFKNNNSNILENDSQFLHWYQSNTILGITMIWNTLKETENFYRRENNYIFLNLEKIFCLGRESFLSFLKKINQKYLVVIDFSDYLVLKQAEDFFMEMLIIIENNKYLKVITLTEKNSLLNESVKNFKRLSPLYKEKLYIARFGDFSLESQEKLLNNTVIFQGKEVPLNNVININNRCDLDAIIDPETVAELVKNTKIEIGTAMPNLGETETYYINRVLVRKIKVESKLLNDDNLTDIFIVSNIRREELSKLVNAKKVIHFGEKNSDKSNPVRFIAVQENFDEGEFINFCSEFKNNTIHWLEITKNGYLIWKKTHGKTLSNLRNSIESYEKELTESDYLTRDASFDFVDVNTVDKFNEKFIVIAAEPGMGKTTALTALGMNKTDQTKWHIRINLKECDLKETNSIIEFLFQNKIISNKLSRKLLTLRLKSQGKIVFLFDEFDEISPESQKNFLTLLRLIEKTNVEKVIISTRLHHRNDLENHLSTLAYTFKPFFRVDQQNFLRKYWAKELDDSIMDRENLDKNVDKLLEFISDSIGDKDRKFMGIPLQMMMVAEAFSDVTKYEIVLTEKELPKDFDILKLYDRFVNAKYTIYMKRNGTKIIDHLSSKGYSKVLMHLAIKQLFPKLKRKILGEKNPSEEDMRVMNLIGIAQYIDGNTVFTHPTFREYFAALFLVETMNNNDRNWDIILQFLSKELFENKNEVIKIFLDYHLSKSKMHLLALKGNFEEFKEILIKTNIDLNDTDILGRSVLHYGAQEGNLKIVDLIKQNGGNTRKQDKLGKTALHYAARYNHDINVVNVLLENGEDFINVKDQNGCTAVFYAAQQGNWNIVDQILTKKNASLDGLDTEKILFHYTYKGYLNRFETVLKKENINIRTFTDSRGNTLLHIAIQRGHSKLTNILVDISDVNATNYSGKTPIHYAAENYDWPAVESLLERKANFNDLCERSKLSLLKKHSIKNSSWDIIKLFFIDNNRDKYCTYLDSQQKVELLCHILSNECSIDDLIIAKYLINKGTPTNIKDQNNKLPIHYASENKLWDVVVHLLQNGAILTDLNEEKQILVLNYSKQKSYWNILILFMKEHHREKYIKYLRADHVRKLLNYVSPLSSFEDKNLIIFLIEQLLKKGSSIKYLNEEEQIILLKHSADSAHSSDSKDKWETVKTFLKSDKRNDFLKYLSEQQKVDLLSHVICSKELDIVMFLLNKGINHALCDSDGKKPLCYAFENKLLLEIMLNKGASFNDFEENDRLYLIKYFIKNSRWHALEQVMSKSGHRDKYYHILRDQQKEISFLLYLLSASNDSIDILIYVIQKLIEFGKIEDVNYRCDKGKSFLHIAAEKGRLSIVRYLLEQRNADINATDCENSTPLLLACKYGHLEVVKYLVSSNADVFIKNVDNKFPLDIAKERKFKPIEEFLSKSKDIRKELFKAVHTGNLEAIKQLIKINELGINFKFKNGFTLLHRAVIDVKPHLIAYLLQNGADVRITDNFGNNALHWTPFMSQKLLLNRLLPDKTLKNVSVRHGSKTSWFCVLFDKDKKEEFSETSEHLENDLMDHDDILCFGTGNFEEEIEILQLKQEKEILNMIKLILNGKNIDIKAKNKKGYSLLHLLASKRSLEALKFLIEENKINVDLLTSNNSSSLFFVTSVKVAEYLIEKGIDINHKNSFGDVALHYASLFGYLDVVKFLVENSASFEMQNNDGENPLHFAVRGKHLSIVKYLISKDAVLTTSNSQGKTALDLAVGQSDIFELIKKELECSLLDAANKDNLTLVKSITHKKINLDVENTENWTPLHIATFRGNLDIVRYLLENGANLLKKGTEYTILHYAVIGSIKNVLILKFILEELKKYSKTFHDYVNAGAYGFTPLLIAVSLKLVRQEEILLKYGANTEVRDDNGMTALHWAARSGCLESVKLLVDNRSDPHCVDNKGRKPIHFAVLHGWITIVNFFIDLGVSVDDVDKDGRSLLHYAFCCNSGVFISLAYHFIINKKADLSIKDKNENSALDFALSRLLGEDIEIEDVKIQQNLAIFEHKNNSSSDSRSHKNLDIDALIDCLQKSFKSGSSIDRDAAIKYKHLAEQFYKKGCYKKVLIVLKLCFFLQNNQGDLGPNYPDSLRTKMMMGVVISKLCRYEEARLNLKEVINVLTKLKGFGPNHPDTLSALHSLGEVYYKQGKYNQALKIYEDVLEKRERILTKNHRDILITKQHIARVMSNQGKLGRALKRFQFVYDLQKEAFGEYDPDTLKTQQNMAFTLYKLSDRMFFYHKLKGASSMILEVISKSKTALGENHPDHLTCRYILALILLKEDVYDTALKTLVEIVSVQENIFGLDHVDTLATKQGIATVLQKLGNQEEALEIFRDINKRKKDLLGQDHPYNSYN